MANYYFLLSGLPDLKLDSPGTVPSVDELRQQILEQDDMGKKDLQQLEMFFLINDCRNLTVLLDDNLAELPYAGNWNKQELQELIADALEDVFEDDKRFPPFMAPFVREYFERRREDGYFPEDRVLVRYWKYLKQHGTGFVRRWAELSLDIANTLTALLCEQQGWDVERYTYDYDASQVDETLMSQLHAIAKDTDPVQKERRIDALKWVWIEDETFLEPFDINALFAYILKADILERWTRLDPEQGKERFQQIIENLRQNVTVPEEFTVYMPKGEGIYNKNYK